MNKINFKGNRNIKKENPEIKPEDKFLNPLNLFIETNKLNDPMYVTSYYFDDDKNLTNYTLEKPKKYIDIKKIMLTPPLLINHNELLKIYNIYDTNILIEFIDNNIETKLFDSLNRIINCWIRQNFNQLIKTNKILIPIYFKLFKKFYNFNVDDKNFNKDIELYLIKWFKLKKSTDFFINLGQDLINYLSNKYE